MDIRKIYLMEKAVSCWNSLNREMVESSSLEELKRCVHVALRDKGTNSHFVGRTAQMRTPLKCLCMNGHSTAGSRVESSDPCKAIGLHSCWAHRDVVERWGAGIQDPCADGTRQLTARCASMDQTLISAR